MTTPPDLPPASALTKVLRCPVCADPLESRPTRSCPTCDTPLHRECGEYIGGCARFACEEAATTHKRVARFLDTVLRSRSAQLRGTALWLAAFLAWHVLTGIGLGRMWTLLPILLACVMGAMVLGFIYWDRKLERDRQALGSPDLLPGKISRLLQSRSIAVSLRSGGTGGWRFAEVAGKGMAGLFVLCGFGFFLHDFPPAGIGMWLLAAGMYAQGEAARLAGELDQSARRMASLWRDEIEAMKLQGLPGKDPGMLIEDGKPSGTSNRISRRTPRG
jgi:hypothetical protein